MSAKADFYDSYHLKNDQYTRVITDNNFTYFYILHFLHQACKNTPASQLHVLDVGCGVGTLCLYLAQKGAKTLGVDVSPRAIEICNRAKKTLGLKSAEFKLGELASGKAAFDVVICSEVIEHVEDEKQLLHRIHEKLKPHGRLLLTTPSKENVLYRLGFYKKFDAEVGHLRRYTAKSIRTLLESNGFTIVTLTPTESLLRNLLFTTKLGILIKGIKGPLIPVFHLFDRALVPVFGATDIVVVAQKS